MRIFLQKYPISLIFAIFIWVICLIPIPETPVSDVRFIDKWTHVVLYLLFSSIMGIEFFRASKKKATPKQLFVPEWLIPVMMGGLVELIQLTCTGGMRSGEWADWIADAIGSTVAYLIGILLVKWRARA